MGSIEKLELATVRDCLDRIAKFLQPCLPMANSHAADFIVNRYWDVMLPKQIQVELLSMSNEQLRSFPQDVLLGTTSTKNKMKCKSDPVKTSSESVCNEETNSDNRDNLKNETEKEKPSFERENDDMLETESHGSKKVDTGNNSDLLGKKEEAVPAFPYSCLSNFFEEARSCTIEGTGLAMSAQDLLSIMDVNFGDTFVSTFMNEKKSHEVEMMSRVCAALATDRKAELVIDFGSGKGYLGKNLSRQYHIPVLGIDASSTNTKSAVRRSTILEKQWEGLTRNKQLESKGLVLTKKEKKKLKQKDVSKIENEISVKSKEEIGKIQVNLSLKGCSIQANVMNSSSDCSPQFEQSACSLCNRLMCECKNNQLKRTNIEGVEEMTRANNYAASFVPCTMFIDKETDFLAIARAQFPHLYHGKSNKNTRLNYSILSPCNSTNQHSVAYANHQKSIKEELCNTGCKFCEQPLKFDSCTLSKNRSTLYNTSSATGTTNISKITRSKMDANSVGDKQSNGDSVSSKDMALNHHGNILIADKTIHSTSNSHKDCHNCIYLGPAKSSVTCVQCTEASTTCIDSELSHSTAHNSEHEGLNLMIVGLHTCGNLASTSVDMFAHNKQLKVLCNVGCCYHMLDEKYSKTERGKGVGCFGTGFPMSNQLNRTQFSLGVTARNLASQSVYRVANSTELQGERFFPRALLEVIIHEVCGKDGVPMKSLRKLEQECQSTQEYIRKACCKLDIPHKISDEMIDSQLARCETDRQKLAAFFQLKTVLAPCIEALIILDRVCFLLENAQCFGIEAVYLVKMFDPSISPRCYGIIAVKENMSC